MAQTTAAQQQPVRATRPPVVVVMGHIDHGKTTLLDFVRKSNVVSRESGGITQHIGAYEIVYNDRRMTFLDTPGHEVFSKMRSRGARVADVAILVVAADDGVKPQTLEALKAILDVHIPFVVAVNKMDKEAANPDKVKSELAEAGTLVEGWGGNVPVAYISAKTGSGVPDLLDLILLSVDLEELTGDPETQASGVVIESHLDARRGAVASLLIKNGTLRKGDFVVIRDAIAAVKILENDRGELKTEATFSSPVTVLGFSKVPAVGEEFYSYKDKKSAEAGMAVSQELRAKTTAPAVVAGRQEGMMILPLVLKTDVVGSREALEGELEKLAFMEIAPRLLKSDVGDIVDDDVKSVSSQKGGVVIGFKVKPSVSAKVLAERFGIEIKTFDVVYELVDWLKTELRRRVPPEVRRVEHGKLKILKVFKRMHDRYVFGGKVTAGFIRNEDKFDIVHGVELKGSGKIVNLQKNKNDAAEVKEGAECGISGDAAIEILEGDMMIAYAEEIVDRELTKPNA
ncbi:MAG: translation initiation factor IF-2 [Candidatus Ryanbacteria bacterium RIFCSPHIGHO2_01_FULL_48_27]|uniref:Translation initiation factor IF-2 n=1 Tax=Candidatus Ryanbacteria bacterium RIFCSPHIGHO2_01_FULL_48_27 TaxID=1802115 RepID=A0A1G2FZU9_9BACT|nr:MAG: translation initiation factor IF-2 [Candidatus Ryanbacteria bacterium RIFCSPHIGHO2_01_FULL_48_27]